MTMGVGIGGCGGVSHMKRCFGFCLGHQDNCPKCQSKALKMMTQIQAGKTIQLTKKCSCQVTQYSQ